jgi:hypothetical protein
MTRVFILGCLEIHPSAGSSGLRRLFEPPSFRSRPSGLARKCPLARNSSAVLDDRDGRRPCENSAPDSVQPSRATVVAIFSHAARPQASKIRDGPDPLTVFARPRRLADIAGRARGCRSWADCAPSRAASGRTGVCAIASFHCELRNRFRRPNRKYRFLVSTARLRR